MGIRDKRGRDNEIRLYIILNNYPFSLLLLICIRGWLTSAMCFTVIFHKLDRGLLCGSNIHLLSGAVSELRARFYASKISLSNHCSPAPPLLQFFFVYESVVSYAAFVLSLFVRPSFGTLGRLSFVSVAFSVSKVVITPLRITHLY